MKTLKKNKVCVREALVGEGNEVAHVDLIIGPRGSDAETAFCIALTNQKCGDNSLLSIVAPNLMTKPPTCHVQQGRDKERETGRADFWTCAIWCCCRSSGQFIV